MRSCISSRSRRDKLAIAHQTGVRHARIRQQSHPGPNGLRSGAGRRKRERGARPAGYLAARLRHGRGRAVVAGRRQARSGPEPGQGLHPRRHPLHRLGQARTGIRSRRHRPCRQQRQRRDLCRGGRRVGQGHRVDFARKLARLQHELLCQGQLADQIDRGPQGQDRRHQRLLHVGPPVAEKRAGKAGAGRDRRHDHAGAVPGDAGSARCREGRSRAVPAAVRGARGKADEGAQDLRREIRRYRSRRN